MWAPVLIHTDEMRDTILVALKFELAQLRNGDLERVEDLA